MRLGVLEVVGRQERQARGLTNLPPSTELLVASCTIAVALSGVGCGRLATAAGVSSLLCFEASSSTVNTQQMKQMFRPWPLYETCKYEFSWKRK